MMKMIVLDIILYKNHIKYYHFAIFILQYVRLTNNLHEKARKKNLLGFLTLWVVLFYFPLSTISGRILN